MNKNLPNQIPADEQPIASKLDSLVEDMQLSPTFQWELETQLMDAAKIKTQPEQEWRTKIIPAMGWAILALGAVFLLNWSISSLAPDSLPGAGETSEPQISFEDNVRQGNICTGPLALAHGFAVFLTNQDKTGFVMLDEQNTIGELRSVAWSPDGKQLAIVGNTTGRGNIYFKDFAGDELEYLLYNSEIGYLMDAAWSRDGKQLLIWSSQNNTIMYLVNTDGTGLVEKQLDMQILATPQFAPDNESIIFYGANSSSDGLFEVMLDGLQTRMISDLVEDDSGFALSPDGSRLAYVEMDRELGEAHLVAQEIATGSKSVLATLPVPKGSGSSLPESANLSWSPDGKALAFEFGRYATDRVVYLAYADGTGLVKLVDSAYAPAISADGKCLAYISNKHVFLMDLSSRLLTSSATTPFLLSELPAGRGIPNFDQDKLQWRP
jgi:Tol biopolymer transport system component